jgi:Mor family transcriptional regulator
MKKLLNKYWKRVVVLALLLSGVVLYAQKEVDRLTKENISIYRENAQLLSYVSLLEKNSQKLTEENKSLRNEVNRKGLEIIATSVHPRITLLSRFNKKGAKIYPEGCKARIALLESKIFSVRDDKDFTDTQKKYLFSVIKYEMMFHLSVCQKALDNL